MKVTSVPRPLNQQGVGTVRRSPGHPQPSRMSQHVENCIPAAALYKGHNCPPLCSSWKPSGGRESVGWGNEKGALYGPFSHGDTCRRDADGQKRWGGGGCQSFLRCWCHPFLPVPASRGCGSMSTAGALAKERISYLYSTWPKAEGQLRAILRLALHLKTEND